VNRRGRERRRRRTQEHMQGQVRRLREAIDHAEERTRARKRGRNFFAEQMRAQGYELRVFQRRVVSRSGDTRLVGPVEVERWVRLPRSER
jgi:predicted membrane GTPase involved in stress response